MASPTHFDDDFDFGGGFGGRHSGNKRSSPDYDDEDYDNDPFAPKKAITKAEEASGVTTGMILSLRESLQNCKDTLATCQHSLQSSISIATSSLLELRVVDGNPSHIGLNQWPQYREEKLIKNELEAAKSEIQSWHSTLKNQPSILAGITPEPKMLINYLQALKSSEESLREQLEKAKKKEAAFIVTFAKREQEIAELKSAVRDLKVQLKPPSMQARRLLLDPAVHEEFTRLKNLVEEKDKKVKELQDNIAAVSFTPQSKMGKMLMAKCRTLQEENEEIGNQASEGKMHELGMKLALQKSQNSQLRNQFEGLQKHMEGLTNDVERSNEMVFTSFSFSIFLVLMLQEKLEEKDRQIQRLKHEIKQKNLEDQRLKHELQQKNLEDQRLKHELQQKNLEDGNDNNAGEAAN
ncbi:FKBP12-interacting protein of 37 kDa [Glycine soja]|uniref:FKBP12-interacting protein of 37 kDa n=1 Tax=Glycine soja TaxID=3848 RepID=A0A445L235_GLYSO|nr:FKBP12-interacting protein of 37 kDa [Glycine soja]